MKGVLVGAIGLLALHALVARANQNQLSGLASVATGFVTRFLDPSIPAIPDHSAAASSTPAATTTYPATPVPASIYAGVHAAANATAAHP